MLLKGPANIFYTICVCVCFYLLRAEWPLTRACILVAPRFWRWYSNLCLCPLHTAWMAVAARCLCSSLQYLRHERYEKEYHNCNEILLLMTTMNKTVLTPSKTIMCHVPGSRRLPASCPETLASADELWTTAEGRWSYAWHPCVACPAAAAAPAPSGKPKQRETHTIWMTCHTVEK